LSLVAVFFRAAIAATILTMPFSVVKAEEWDDLLGDRYEAAERIEKAARPSSANKQRLQVVKRLDQEILILRAELAKKQNNVRRVRQYLNELDKQHILPPFISRVEQLQQFVANNSDFLPSHQAYVQQIQFPLNDPKAVVAIVLPTSGEYGVAGLSIQNAIQEGLKKSGFAGQLIAVDSSLYTSANEIWQILRPYQPDFIFGPLEKDKVIGWKQLGTRVQTLFFNDSGYLGVGEFSLTPNRLAGLEQVFQLLQQAQYQNILVLRDLSQSSAELEEAFQQAWLNIYPNQHYNLEIVDGNVGQSIDDVLAISNSEARHRWLQKVMSASLEFEARTRQDVEAVISFVPQNLAIQIAPYLDYLSAQREITHIWYPSKTPSASYLQFNIDAWQQTFVVLPQSISIKTSRKKSQIETNSKNGLFYALGRVAVEIVSSPQLSASADTIETTDYGSFVRNASGQFQLLPVVYWADNGKLSRF